MNVLVHEGYRCERCKSMKPGKPLLRDPPLRRTRLDKKDDGRVFIVRDEIESPYGYCHDCAIVVTAERTWKESAWQSEYEHDPNFTHLQMPMWCLYGAKKIKK